MKWNTCNPLWNHAFEPTRVPERLEIKIWDKDGEDKADPLGYAIIRRKRMWDVCYGLRNGPHT